MQTHGYSVNFNGYGSNFKFPAGTDIEFSKQLDQLGDRLINYQNIWILTGAGISAPSGIPTYRDHDGVWQHHLPIQHEEFRKQFSSRQKYWARSLVGWPVIEQARPNPGHHAVTDLQGCGRVSQVVTQNVDRLHSLAGTKDVIDLHGRLDENICLDCGRISKRADFQMALEQLNPSLVNFEAGFLPDGDADLQLFDETRMSIPACPECAGIIMPNVIFFGGSVPRQRLEHTFHTLEISDCVLVLGSSISVYSGFRFVQWAHKNGLPLYSINQGEMRGAELFDTIVPAPCEITLPELVARL